jgi:signal peptidase II
MTHVRAHRRGLGAWLALAATIAVLDQLTKWGLAHYIAPGQVVEVTPFFNLVHVFNRGAAFSFLADAGGWQRTFFIVVTLAAIAFILYLLRRHADETLFCLGLTLILGGAVGNLYDRVAHGHVVDFLDFHAAGWHWPAFNVADSGITVGAALLVIDALFANRRAPVEPPGKAAR